MTKEELIESSDLNREDNIKYISSEAQGIAIALDSDRYAPTLCKLERAYICGRRKSEEQISELEKENEQLTISYETLKLHDEEEIGMLKSENAELKKTYRKQRNKRIDELQKENAELKKTYRKQCNKRIDEFQKENAELKEKLMKEITGLKID